MLQSTTQRKKNHSILGNGLQIGLEMYSKAFLPPHNEQKENVYFSSVFFHMDTYSEEQSSLFSVVSFPHF